ncbi:HAD hydrolase-like protein [Marinagarivorans algicola]|uniref:HAD hydrolase-like protein n=1 Tax=Marinagarivorans algicola TaxID=1513270 RepID=UPI0006B44024|nr:HAD hydrolase-like protein [Marinagarivorans algicola]
MKLPPPQLVIYDLDGTLIDSVPSIALALNNTLQQALMPRVSEQQVRLWVGNGSLMLIRRALEALQADLKQLDRIHQHFLDHYGRQVQSSPDAAASSTTSSTFAGTHELMALFKRHGVAQAIATNKPQQFVPAILSAEGLMPFVSAIVGGNSLPECKPSPLPLLTLCSRFHCPPSRALMIGDSTADAKSAQHAGIPCWLVEQGYAQGIDLQQLGAQSVFKDTRQLLHYATQLMS